MRNVACGCIGFDSCSCIALDSEGEAHCTKALQILSVELPRWCGQEAVGMRALVKDPRQEKSVGAMMQARHIHPFIPKDSLTLGMCRAIT